MKLVIVLLFVGVISTPTFSWVYPEHRDIAILAVQKLSPEYRSIFNKLWREARKGFEYRLTEALIDATLRVGLGIDGIINESGDGLVFFDIGWRQDRPATMKYGESTNNIEGGQITSAIPGRVILK